MGKVWAFIRIVNVRLRFIMLMAIVGVVASQWEVIVNHYDRWRRPIDVSAAEGEHVEYYCPMHPNVIKDEPGKCPLCGMPLSKRAKTAGPTSLPAGVLAQVNLTPQKIELGRLAVASVDYRLMTHEIRSVGTVDYNQTGQRTISARIKGRLDKLYVDSVGQQVKKGEPLADIYSPELLVAQDELLSAAKSAAAAASKNDFAAQAARDLLASARKKLQLWDITDEQIDRIIKDGKTQKHVTIYSPIDGIVTDKKVVEGRYVMEGEELYSVADLSTVWLQAKIFESDLGDAPIGTVVEVTCTAYPKEVFPGKVTFLAYSVDPATRTVAARIQVDNPEYKLRPGMFAAAVIRQPAGKVEYVDAAARPAPVQVATYELAKAYLAVSEALASDKTDDDALEKLMQQTEAVAAKAPQAAGLVAAIRKMHGQAIAGQRDAFVSASAEMIKLAKLSPPKDLPLWVANCPMKPGDWLTAGQAIRNPFYGSEMLECGSITGQIKYDPAAAGIITEGQFAYGYYCPLHPDELKAKPEDCDLDKLPRKFARLEKVLTVPESAVIDTGTRKVVYRQSAAGTYDMIEVTLGPRSGEFFPVLTGLKSGDQVVTQGAFLVDAENRLNPAASAQFYGASGSPQAEHKH